MPSHLTAKNLKCTLVLDPAEIEGLELRGLLRRVEG
jgi:hypothetical protein